MKGGCRFSDELTEPGVVAVARAPQQRQEVDLDRMGERWAMFTMLVFFACNIMLILEFHVNASGADFSAPPTQACYFRAHSMGGYCAASMAANPTFGPAPATLRRLGAIDRELIVQQKQAWRLVTAIFLHTGALHCFFNMLALLELGRHLEHIHGWLRIATIFMCSGIFGAIGSATFGPKGSLSVGASGAIFGLVGAALGDILINWKMYRSPCCKLIWLCFITGVQLVLGTMPLLDNFAHTFGFAMGLVCSLAILTKFNPGKDCFCKLSRRVVRLIAACSVVVAFVVGISVLFGYHDADANALCPSCAHLSCANFPWGCNPTEKGSCWWTCDPNEAPPSCTGEATFVSSPLQGTVTIGCPKRGGGTESVVVQPVDVSNFGDEMLGQLCLDHCPGAA